MLDQIKGVPEETVVPEPADVPEAAAAASVTPEVQKKISELEKLILNLQNSEKEKKTYKGLFNYISNELPETGKLYQIWKKIQDTNSHITDRAELLVALEQKLNELLNPSTNMAGGGTPNVGKFVLFKDLLNNETDETTQYTHDSNNAVIQKYRDLDNKYRAGEGINMVIKYTPAGGKEVSVEKTLLVIKEEIFKIPGILVKIIDNHKLKTISDDISINRIDRNGNCVKINKECGVGGNPPTISNYGPFRHVVAPNKKDGNPKNEDTFDYLVKEDGYNLGKLLTDGKDNTDRTNIKLFGYGFSGSGKTYTLLQGGDKILYENGAVKSPADPSLLSHLLLKLKSTDWPAPNPDVGFARLEIKVFYPLKDYEKTDVNNYYVNRVKAASNSSTKKAPTIMDQINTDVTKPLNEEIENPDITGEVLSSFIKQKLEALEKILGENLLVLPTINNPSSSRAFTIIDFILNNGSKVSFIDLPGLEKKTTMIRDHYIKTDTDKAVKTKVTGKKTKVTGEKNTPGKKENSYLEIKKGDGDWMALGFENVDKYPKNKNDLDQYFNKFAYTANEKLEFTLTKEGADTLNADDNNKKKTISVLSQYITYLVKMSTGMMVAKNEIIGPRDEFSKSSRDAKETYGKFVKDSGLKILLYLNYTLKFIPNYTYTISEAIVKAAIKIFKKKFINDDKFKVIDSDDTIPDNIIKKTYVRIWNLYHPDYKGLSDQNKKFDKGLETIFNMTGSVKYINPSLTCLAKILSLQGDNVNSILYIVKFTSFTLDQGGKIVSSLEHLLYRFLKQIPNGINTYNAKHNDNKNEKFIETTYKPDEKMITYPDKDEKGATGMIEEIERKYCQGMDTILGLGDDNELSNERFLCLLAMVRNESSETTASDEFIKNKRCQGAIDTVKFAKTLTQTPDEPSCGTDAVIELKGMTDKQVELKNDIDDTLKQLPTNNDTPKLDKNAITIINKSVVELYSEFQSE
jgi:hypothetical protein